MDYSSAEYRCDKCTKEERQQRIPLGSLVPLKSERKRKKLCCGATVVKEQRQQQKRPSKNRPSASPKEAFSARPRRANSSN